MFHKLKVATPLRVLAKVKGKTPCAAVVALNQVDVPPGERRKK
jgi:hypothetical protein